MCMHLAYINSFDFFCNYKACSCLVWSYQKVNQKCLLLLAYFKHLYLFLFKIKTRNVCYQYLFTMIVLTYLDYENQDTYGDERVGVFIQQLVQYIIATLQT